MASVESESMRAQRPVAIREPRTEQDPYYTSSPFEPRIDPPTTLDQIDLTDGDLLQFGDPHAAWRMRREQSPLHWHAKTAPGTRGKGFWAVTSTSTSTSCCANTELLGVPLNKGDYVADYLGSANRDPDAFHDPYRFEVTRGRESPIFTFGGGPHLCIGAQFARLEMKVIFEELLRRFPDIEQADRAERGEAFTMILSPLAQLPVRLGDPASGS